MRPGSGPLTQVASSRSVPSSVKASTPPAMTRRSPSATILAAIRSQGLRVCVAVRSVTSTGSLPRIRSRARKDCPGTISLTSCKLMTEPCKAVM